MFRQFPFMAPEGEAPAAGAPGAAPAAAAPGAAAVPAAGAAPAAGADPGSIIAESKPVEAAKPGEAPGAKPAEPTAAERSAYLTGKGLKADELAKLDEAGLKAKHDELKAADAKAEAISKIE